jgi:hypothetical protein
MHSAFGKTMTESRTERKIVSPRASDISNIIGGESINEKIMSVSGLLTANVPGIHSLHWANISTERYVHMSKRIILFMYGNLLLYTEYTFLVFNQNERRIIKADHF